MPQKFTLFKVFNIVSLLIALITVIKFGYELAGISFQISRDEWISVIILALAVISYAGTNLWSLWFCQKYKLQEDINRVEKITAIVFFFCQAIFQLLFLFYFSELLSNTQKSIRYNLERGLYVRLVLQLFPMLIFLLTIYCQLLFFPILKAIKQRALAKQLDELGRTEIAS